VRRKAGKAFVNGVEDPDVKIQLLVGGEKTVNEALRQALELQAVFLAARLRKTPLAETLHWLFSEDCLLELLPLPNSLSQLPADS
jgi:hypothetical protein